MRKKYPGLEARLGGVVAAVGADGVHGIRIDLHLRIIVAAGQEPHLDWPPNANGTSETERCKDQVKLLALGCQGS